MKRVNKTIKMPWAITVYADGFLSDDIIVAYYSKTAAKEHNCKNIVKIVISEGSMVTLGVYLDDNDISFDEEIVLDSGKIIDGKGFYIYE